MALIHISQKELCSLSGLKANDVEPILTSLGIPLEGVEGDDLSLEITPNRPDWLSVEGVARSCYSFKSGKPKIYSAEKASISWHIDSSIRAVRPILGSAVVHNVQMTEPLLTSLIQLQEKLHDTLGRKRAKMAIGIHDLRAVQPPFTYSTVSRDEVRFVPLGKTAPLTPGQIMLEHEKGIAYAHLVGERCPLITDANGEVLSFPPIINGERTRLGIHSTDLLIDCTGNSESVVNASVNIICAALADRGAQISEVKMDGKPYPLFEPSTWKNPAAAASKLLGIPLTPAECARHLRRLGHDANEKTVRSPAFRADLLHEVDLIEDVAISIGLNELPMPRPDFASQGQLVHPVTSFLHESMIGLGYFEVMSWILTSQPVLARAGVDISPAALRRVSNPLSEDFTTLRPWLYPNLLDIFSRSKSESLPQYLYEIGPVEQRTNEMAKSEAASFHQIEHLGAAAIHPKACFSQALAHLQGLLSSRGKAISLLPEDKPGFIPGRCAILMHGHARVGLIGEIHPQVLSDFGLEQPVALFEVETGFLKA